MRLNRVLLLAATVNILIFALVFTISCSNGDDGKAGKDGDRCIVDEDYNIVCNGQEVGSLIGGTGKDGDKGDKGAPGETGESCWVAKSATGTGWDVLCGKGDGTPRGVLDGCKVSQGSTKYELNIICGDTQVSICGKEIFDNEIYGCEEGGNGADTLRLLTDNPIGYCGDAKVEYDTRKQYCGIAESGDSTVYSNCPKGTAAGQTVQKPNQSAWKNEYCRWTTDSTVIADTTRCGDGKTINEKTWQGQYCGYKGADAKTTSVLDKRCTKKGYALFPRGQAPEGYPTASSGFDDPYPYPYFVLGTDNFPDTIYNVYGPSQAAFNQGYCTVLPEDRDAKTKDGKPVTTYTEVLCGGNFSTGRVNQDTWKGQYCGFGKDSKFADQVLSGGTNKICGNGEGPNEKEYGKKFCGYKNKNSTVTEPLPYCLQVTLNTSGVVTGYTPKPYNNTGTSFKGDYCGFRKNIEYYIASNPAASSGAFHLLVTIPKFFGKDTYGKDTLVYNGTFSANASNFDGIWLGDTVYTNTESNKQQTVGACGDLFDSSGTTASSGWHKAPNWPIIASANYSLGNGPAYCRFKSANKAKNRGFYDSYLTTTYCASTSGYGFISNVGNPTNRGSWKGQYCGRNELGNKQQYTGACDNAGDDLGDDPGAPDGYSGSAGPNSKVYNKYFCGFARASTGTWPLEKCVLNPDDKLTITAAQTYNAATATDAKFGVATGSSTDTVPKNWTGKYNKDYCGWKVDKPGPTAILAVPNDKFVYRGTECDMPYINGSDSIYGVYYASNGAGDVNDIWGGYCQVRNATDKRTWAVGSTGANGYCYQLASKNSKITTAPGTPRTLNQDTWKNEYCDKLGLVKACPNNWIGDPLLDSFNDAFCRPPNANSKPLAKKK